MRGRVSLIGRKNGLRRTAAIRLGWRKARRDPAAPAGRIDEDKIIQYGRRKEEIFRDEAVNVQAIEGVLNFLEDLDSAQLPMGVASSGSRTRVDFLLRQLDLKKRFRVVVTADEVAHGKPDPAVFLKAAQDLQIHPSDLIAFEDAASGVRAAIAAGMTCVGIAQPDRASILIDAGAIHVARDFRSLSYSKLREIVSQRCGDEPAEGATSRNLAARISRCP